MAVDASDTGVGAVLLQETSGVEHPVGYFSKKLAKYRRYYSTVEKETCALLLALSHFVIYIANSVSPIIIYTDHNPLVFINKVKDKNQRLLQWSVVLQEYDLEIKHIKGKENLIADALSRVH